MILLPPCFVCSPEPYFYSAAGYAKPDLKQAQNKIKLCAPPPLDARHSGRSRGMRCPESATRPHGHKRANKASGALATPTSAHVAMGQNRCVQGHYARTIAPPAHRDWSKQHETHRGSAQPGRARGGHRRPRPQRNAATAPPRAHTSGNTQTAGRAGEQGPLSTRLVRPPNELPPAEKPSE